MSPVEMSATDLRRRPSSAAPRPSLVDEPHRPAAAIVMLASRGVAVGAGGHVPAVAPACASMLPPVPCPLACVRLRRRRGGEGASFRVPRPPRPAAV